ncbi:MAG: hypothetical protein WBQ94_21075 [Terracidiphilus sp.]
MRQRECLIVVPTSVLISFLMIGCPGSTNGGSGSALRVNFAVVAKSPDARKLLANQGVDDPGTEPTVPSRPTTGTRKQAAAALVATPPAFGIFPCIIAFLPCRFDGVAQGTFGSPPDPNAAVGNGDIVEVVNDQIQVTNRRGAVLCGGSISLQTLLSTTDKLTDPRVQFDNVNQRFSLSVTVSGPLTTDIPAIHVAATETADPCGNWFSYRLTFHGDAYPTGDFLDFPMLGQDQNALLLSLRTCTNSDNCSKAIFTVFGLPKSTIYSGQNVEFNAFQVDSLTAPVTNAGHPTIASPVSFFLAAVPGTGYKLYRLTNSGGAGASLSKTTISDPFSTPSRGVNQPGASSPAIDPSDGSITSFPYFDGTFIWFAHDADEDGFPTVRYGKVEPSKNTVETTFAFHSGSSDDFNPSIAVGFAPSGEKVFFNWVFTDTPAGTATTNVFAEGDARLPLVQIAGPGTVDVTGGVLPNQKCVKGGNNQCRFGDFSSVSVDPDVAGCAFATQQYFATDGDWKTRITPIGQCGNIVVKGPPR